MRKQILNLHTIARQFDMLARSTFGRQTLVLLLTAACVASCFVSTGLAQDQAQIIGPDPLDFQEAGQRELVLHFPWKLRLPSIARYQNLPQRMLVEPFLEEAKFTRRLPPQHVKTWISCLTESEDLEIQAVALEHLARIARLNDTDLSPIADHLIEILQQTNDRQLFWGALCAVRDGNLQQAASTLLDLAKNSNDDTLRIVDPLLASWSYEPAIAVWQARLIDTNTTATNRLLACQALAKNNAQQAVQTIYKIAADTSSSFHLRQAAAVALCDLDPEAARALAKTSTSSSLRDKLLLVTLLSQSHEDAMQSVMPFCDDQNQAVALAAWEAVQSHDAKKLLTKLNDGMQHQESGIRLCCTRVVAEFPNQERLQVMLPLLADPHIAVRNACRATLSTIAEAKADLEQPIVDFLAKQIRTESTKWELIEQACYALAELKRPEFADACLQRCRHERQEVYVAAAWLYHLMPDPRRHKELKDVLEERMNRIISSDYRTEFSELDRQIGFLLQAGGYSQHTELLDIMLKQLNKASSLGEQGRGAGVWGIGALKAGSKDKTFSDRVTTIMNDRVSPVEPEFDSVRRMAAQSVGRIASESSIPTLQEAFRLDTTTTGIPQTARWALQTMGEASPGRFRPFTETFSGWRLQPIAPTK